MTASKKALKVQYVSTTSLKPYARNARMHTPEQIDKIKALIQRFGWTNPILVDGKNGVVAGHGRLQAAKQLGMKQVPVIELAGMSAADKRAYVLADNRVAEESSWDQNLLKLEFGALKDMGTDLGFTGFDPTEIAGILEPKEGEPEEPPVPALEKATVAKLGDVWHLGDHRLACGDCTKPETLEAMMEGRKAQVVFTDPPYGVSYDARSDQWEPVQGDEKRRAALLTLLSGSFQAAALNAAQRAAWYVWHASSTRDVFSQALRDAGVIELGYLIWVKPAIVLGWSDYRWAHEPCIYGARQGQRPDFHGGRDQSTIWRIAIKNGTREAATIGTGITIATKDGGEIHVTPAPPKGKKARHVIIDDGQDVRLHMTSATDNVWEVSRDRDPIHPTQKPVELARRALRNSSREGEAVLDPFSGSGSTIIAAEQTKRVAYAVELDPRYVDATIKRWQTLTGRTATRKGKPFKA